ALERVELGPDPLELRGHAALGGARGGVRGHPHELGAAELAALAHGVAAHARRATAHRALDRSRHAQRCYGRSLPKNAHDSSIRRCSCLATSIACCGSVHGAPARSSSSTIETWPAYAATTSGVPICELAAMSAPCASNSSTNGSPPDRA